jgi:hypothetical protein
MSRIDSSASLIARIQAQLRAATAAEPMRARRARASDPRPGERADASADLMSTVASRVALIDKDDPDRERKALRVFLEAVLLAELGTGLAADPRFAEMLDHIQDQFDADPELARAATEAARHLLAGSGEPG